jgi:hypothetical protein
VQTDGYKLDKNHTFKVSMFDDFDRYAKVPDVYAAPEIKEYSPTVSQLGQTWSTCVTKSQTF